MVWQTTLEEREAELKAQQERLDIKNEAQQRLFLKKQETLEAQQKVLKLEQEQLLLEQEAIAREQEDLLVEKKNNNAEIESSANSRGSILQELAKFLTPSLNLRGSADNALKIIDKNDAKPCDASNYDNWCLKVDGLDCPDQYVLETIGETDYCFAE